MRTLFPIDPYPPSQPSPTSQAAAVAIEPKCVTLRRLYLDWLRAQKDQGGTDEEAQDALHLGGSTQRPRRVECVHGGLVRDSGRTRKTRSGRETVVWVAVV